MYHDRAPFSVFLVQHGAIQPEELVRILDMQYKGRQPFGRIALRTRKLNVRQTSEILSYQALNPDERFGEIAVKMGYMTNEDVAEILTSQRKSTPSIEEIILSEGLLTAEELRVLKAQYESPVGRSTAAA